MLENVKQAGQQVIEADELIEFESHGRCLLIGSAAMLSALLPRLQDLKLYCYALDMDEIDAETDVSVSWIKQGLSELSGWLGNFKARFGERELMVDLVLDMSDQPIISSPVPPLGYFAPKQNGQALAEALQQLPELVGLFDKPRYFNYNADICAHGRRGVDGCHNCIDACPADAITSNGNDSITVNPSLCQGCGSCTVACPSGAISYALPSLDASIGRLQKMLQQYWSETSEPPQLLIHDDSDALERLEAYNYPFANDVIAFSIEEIGALGQPFWLSALAFGIARVVIWDAGTHQDHDWQEVKAAIEECNAMLAELGYGSERIEFLVSDDIAVLQQTFADKPDATDIEPARFAGIDDKRRMTTMALSHLHQQSITQPEMMNLSETAAFGEILLDKQACTLCMSCVSVCPAGAVVDGVDKPQLNFIEDLCVQCGICEQACPENAINLHARYVFDRNQARQKRVLHEEAIFHCIRCNKPFATQKMIDTVMSKLADHPMFQGDALETLKMCEDCRVKAMFK